MNADCLLRKYCAGRNLFSSLLAPPVVHFLCLDRKVSPLFMIFLAKGRIFIIKKIELHCSSPTHDLSCCQVILAWSTRCIGYMSGCVLCVFMSICYHNQVLLSGRPSREIWTRREGSRKWCKRECWSDRKSTRRFSSVSSEFPSIPVLVSPGSELSTCASANDVWWRMCFWRHLWTSRCCSCKEKKKKMFDSRAAMRNWHIPCQREKRDEKAGSFRFQFMYSKTCLKRPPHSARKNGRYRQVVKISPKQTAFSKLS